jgi:hypothetical protein
VLGVRGVFYLPSIGAGPSARRCAKPSPSIRTDNAGLLERGKKKEEKAHLDRLGKKTAQAQNHQHPLDMPNSRQSVNLRWCA